MKKFIVWIVLITGLVILFVYFRKKNGLEVIAKDTDKLKIVWSAKTENGKSISEIVFENGESSIDKMENIYGVNGFTFYQNDSLLGTFIFHKGNWHDVYDFTIYIDDSIVVKSNPDIKFHWVR